VFWEWISTFEFLNKVSEVPSFLHFSCLFDGFFMFFGASLQGVGRWAMVGWSVGGRSVVGKACGWGSY